MIEQNKTARVETFCEDNNSILILPNTEFPKLTCRLKPLAVKYHWFKNKVQNSSEKMVMKKINSEKQKAEIFTKTSLMRYLSHLGSWFVDNRIRSALERECGNDTWQHWSKTQLLIAGSGE